MNTTQRITKTAQALGYTFRGGYTTDRMGHVVSHRTVRDFIGGAA